jgi:alkylation response protein AidB-like acyl-CoA dehydrogenase
MSGTIGCPATRRLFWGRRLPTLRSFSRPKAGGELSLWIVPLHQDGVEIQPLKTIDQSIPHAHLSFDGAGAERLGGKGEGLALLNLVLDRAAVLLAWEQLGGADACLEMAKQYAIGRYAFGRPVASYQAIQHKLVDMYVKNTLARSNAYFAIATLTNGGPELPLAAATARLSSNDAYAFASKENIQVHGGMGYTWEYDCHLHYRRAKLLSTTIGSTAFWQNRLIDASYLT